MSGPYPLFPHLSTGTVPLSACLISYSSRFLKRGSNIKLQRFPTENLKSSNKTHQYRHSMILSYPYPNTIYGLTCLFLYLFFPDDKSDYLISDISSKEDYGSGFAINYGLTEKTEKLLRYKVNNSDIYNNKHIPDKIRTSDFKQNCQHHHSTIRLEVYGQKKAKHNSAI